MQIVVVGTGYVGLVTGACFAAMGNHVTCVDVDQKKLEKLRQGEIPIFEPGLEQLVIQARDEALLHFSDNLAEALKMAQICFIAVGTPPGEDGSADLKYVLAVAHQIGQSMMQDLLVVDKSTVPVGTADQVQAAIQQELTHRGENFIVDVVSNPEFLKEGSAVEDFMRPDRIIVGTESERAQQLMTELYEPFARTRNKILFMGVRDAEMTKYVANAMLATKISFMNEMANLCERLGADVESVRLGIGSDARIGYSFIYPGCGYGGSCFPKDVQALVHMAEKNNFSPWILKAVEQRNQAQKQRLFEKINDHFQGQLAGKTFGVWGLAFKPNTDDVREAPALDLLIALVKAGAQVRAYDPEAMETIMQALPAEIIASKKIQLCEHLYDVFDGADAFVLVTEWKVFRQPDFARIKTSLSSPIIFDGRNQYDPGRLRGAGFIYYGIGR